MGDSKSILYLDDGLCKVGFSSIVHPSPVTKHFGDNCCLDVLVAGFEEDSDGGSGDDDDDEA